MRTLITSFLVCICFTVNAQHGKYDLLEDSVGGWVQIYQPTAVKPYTSKGGITYSANKMKDIDNIIQWVQSSSIPIGGRGYFKKSFAPQKEEYLPECHGVYFTQNTWSFDTRTGARFEEGGSQSQNEFWIMTNSIPFRQDVPALCSSSQHVYLSLPEDFGKELSPSDKNYDRFTLHKDPRLSIWPIFYRDNGYGSIVLSPDNKLPVIELSRSQVLDLYQANIPVAFEKEKENLKSKWGSNPKSLAEELKNLEEKKLTRWKEGIQKIRDKYSDKLDEPAVLRGPNPPDMINFYNNDELFLSGKDRDYATSLRFYQLEKGVVEKSRQDKPLWVTIRWYQPHSTDLPSYKERNRALREHLDIDYIYDCFFNPALVKGKPYKPLNEELLKSTIASYKRRDYLTAADTKFPEGIFYAEDFSKQIIGEKPKGWFFKFNGEPSIIATVAGQNGKWLELGFNNAVSPTSVKNQLPENFSLEYDILSGEYNYRSGASVEFNLGTVILEPVSGIAAFDQNSPKITVTVTGGNEENLAIYAGSATMVIDFPTSLKLENSYAEMGLTDFTNRKRKAHITIQKKGNELKVFVNNKAIPYTDQNKKDISQQFLLPADVRFNGFNLRNGSSQPHQKTYIGNIKITKD